MMTAQVSMLVAARLPLELLLGSKTISAEQLQCLLHKVRFKNISRSFQGRQQFSQGDMAFQAQECVQHRHAPVNLINPLSLEKTDELSFLLFVNELHRPNPLLRQIRNTANIKQRHCQPAGAEVAEEAKRPPSALRIAGKRVSGTTSATALSRLHRRT